MKTKEHKPLKGSPITSQVEDESIPDGVGQGAGEDNHDEPNKRDMSHVEGFLNGLDDEEASHAHEHLKKRIEPKAALNEGGDGSEPSYDSFMKVKNQD